MTQTPSISLAQTKDSVTWNMDPHCSLLYKNGLALHDQGWFYPDIRPPEQYLLPEQHPQSLYKTPKTNRHEALYHCPSYSSRRWRSIKSYTPAES